MDQSTSNRGAVAELAQDLDVGDYIEQFTSSLVCADHGPALALRVWPLERLAKADTDFVERWQDIWRQVEAAGVSDAQTFVLRFWQIHEYQRFFLEDPDLPSALMPPDWPGPAAATLFELLHDRLAPGANRFIDKVFVARNYPASPRL